MRKIIKRIFGDFFGLEKRQHIGWSHGLVSVFDQLEQQRLLFNREKFSAYIKTAKAVKGSLKKHQSPEAKQALVDLKLRTTALKYRLGSEYKDKYAIQKDPDPKLLQELKPLVEEWKKTQIVFKTHALSPAETLQLETLARYPKLAELVLDTPALRHKFFDWAFLAKNNVHAFVQFPLTVGKLMEVGLSERIGRYGGQDLKIEDREIYGQTYKDLTLPFEGKSHSILNEKEVITLSYDYRLSIGDVFRIFKERKCVMGNLEYFGKGQGITNWNCNEWGAYNPAKNDYERVNVDDPDWIKKMPFIDEMSHEEALNHFEDKNGQKLKFEPHDWIFEVIANNQFKHANLTGTHTILCIGVPLENGRRGLCYMGKFAWEFPDIEKEKKRYARIAFDAVRASIQCPDENVFQNKRDKEGIAWRFTEEEARRVLNKIRKDKRNIEKGLFFFQFLVYNCADWAFKKLRHKVSQEEYNEVAAMSMWDAKPEGFIANVIKLPPKLRLNMLDLAIKIVQPEIVINYHSDGRERPIGLTKENAPWREGRTKAHPSQMINGKRMRKEKLEVAVL